ncbi:MAG: hypothetical protein ACRC78_01525 [Planktothrix sp.]
MIQDAMNPKATPHARITADEFKKQYQQGLITAKGLLFNYLLACKRKGWVITAKVSELSESLGITRKTFYKVLKELLAQGLIDFEIVGEIKLWVTGSTLEESDNELQKEDFDSDRTELLAESTKEPVSSDTHGQEESLPTIKNNEFENQLEELQTIYNEMAPQNWSRLRKLSPKVISKVRSYLKACKHLKVDPIQTFKTSIKTLQNLAFWGKPDEKTGKIYIQANFQCLFIDDRIFTWSDGSSVDESYKKDWEEIVKSARRGVLSRESLSEKGLVALQKLGGFAAIERASEYNLPDLQRQFTAFHGNC